MAIKNLYKGNKIVPPYWYDLGIDNFTGTFIGTPILRNAYAEFNGSQRVELDKEIAKYLANQSFALTFLLRSNKDDNSLHTLFSNRWVGSNYGYIGIYIDENEKINFRTVTIYSEEVSITSVKEICDSKWHLIHCQRNGIYQSIFIDGALDAVAPTSSQTSSSNLYYNPQPRIGAESSGGAGAHSRFLIGDIMIIIHRNEAMTYAEIKTEYTYYFGLLE